MSNTALLTHTPPIRPRRATLVALWIVQIGVAAMFLLAGGSKLFGVPAMVALFDGVGVGQWFRYVTGFIEVGSAVALLTPRLAVYGALALVPTAIGAIATHLFIVGGSPAPAAVLLVGAAVVLWARRHELPIRQQQPTR